MLFKDLIGHKILDVRDDVECMIKTDRGFYELNMSYWYDGSFDTVEVEEILEEDFTRYDKK